MNECGWFDAFKRRMDVMGAEVPSCFFDTYDKSIMTLSALVAAANLNPQISAVAALSVSSVGGFGVIVSLAGLGAAAYSGVVAGCMLMAAIDNAVCVTEQKRVTPQGVVSFLHKIGIYDTVMIENEIMGNPRIMALR